MKPGLDYLMITPAYPPRMGGVEKHVSEIHRTLTAQGKRGKVLVLGVPRPENAPIADDVIWMEYRRLGGLPKTARVYFVIRLVALILSLRPALIHFHDCYTLLPWRLLMKLLRVPVYITFHGWDGLPVADPRVSQHMQQCAAAVRGSIAIGDFIPSFYQVPITIMAYGGIETERFAQVHTPCDELPFKIAYLGRFEPDTGVAEIVAAAAQYFDQSGERIELHLFGYGSLEPEFRAAAADPRLNLTLHRPVDDIVPVLQEFPAIFVSGYLTIIEALFTQRIAFAYYNNARREEYLRVHPAADSMFILGSSDDMNAAINQCRSDFPAAMAKCRPGWEWARTQSWERMAGSYLELWGVGDEA